MPVRLISSPATSSTAPKGTAFLVGLALAASPAAVDDATAMPNGLSRTGVKSMVVREARALDVPVELALAVAHVESNFDPRAESHKGARGVMQIMPATALGEYGISPEMLWNPRINIRLGLHFLRRLIDRYRGRTDLALSYYNGGSRVGAPGRARIIPATRGYVRKVNRLTIYYRNKSEPGSG